MFSFSGNYHILPLPPPRPLGPELTRERPADGVKGTANQLKDSILPRQRPPRTELFRILTELFLVSGLFSGTSRARETIQLGSGTIQSLGAAAEEELSILID